MTTGQGPLHDAAPGFPQPELAAIWAQAKHRVIGRDGQMPWHCPADFAFFKEQTVGFPVIMGRSTWESFPARFRPLPGRSNIVLSRTAAVGEHEGAWWAVDLPSALRLARQAPGGQERIWILGGASLYREALNARGLPEVQGGRVLRVLVTELGASVDGDAQAPVLGPEWQCRELAAGTDERAMIIPPQRPVRSGVRPDGAAAGEASEEGAAELVSHPLDYRFLEFTRR